MTVSQIPQIAFGYLMPSVIIPKFGINACFLVLAAGAGVSMLCAATIVDRVDGHPDAKHGQLKLTAPLAVFVLGVLLQNFCMGSVWGYIEQLAHQRRFDPDMVGIAVGGGLASMGIGSSLAAWVADRVSSLKMLIASSLVQVACTLSIILATSPVTFIAPLYVMCLFWTSVVPFTIGESVALDPTRRVALLNPALNLTGQAVGPLLVSFFVEEGNVLDVYRISVVLFAMATVAFMVVRALTGRASRAHV
jgi:predicted MFS family arabinose efflux permease